MADPSDAQLETYHSDNTDTFRRPETRVISYVWITPEMLAPGVDIAEDLIRAEYDARSDQYNTPERRLVERLVFGTRDEAMAASDRLTAGVISFEDLVSERGLELGDIDLGDVTRSELDAAADAVFALEDNGLTGVVDSALGPAIFRINAILYARTTEYDEVAQALNNELAMDEARGLIADLSAEVDDMLAGGATVEEVAAETELELGTIEYTQGVDQGIAAYGDFHRVATGVNEGDFPEVERLSDGGIFALRLDEIQPSRPLSLAEARDDVATRWRTTQVTDALTTRAEAMAEQIASGATMESFGFDVETRAGVTRQAAPEGLPGSSLAAIFAAAVGETDVLQNGDSVVLLKIDGETPADLADGDVAVQRAAIESEMAQSMARDLFQAYTNALQRDAGISLNQQAINAVHAQFP